MKKLLILLACSMMLSSCCWLCEQQRVLQHYWETQQRSMEVKDVQISDRTHI
ncbi:hypothetical protein ES708_00741 [subsurface metagenome]